VVELIPGPADGQRPVAGGEALDFPQGVLQRIGVDEGLGGELDGVIG